eukprot:g13848.t1
MDDQKQADIVDKMIKTSGKFNGSGFSEWYEKAMDGFRLRSEGIFAIVQGQPCPRPVYQTSRRSRFMSRERRRTTAESRAVAAEVEAAAAASAAQEAIAAAITAGNDERRRRRRSAAGRRPGSGGSSYSSSRCSGQLRKRRRQQRESDASSDVPVDFTYVSATELPTRSLGDTSNATFKPKPDMMFNGIAAWKALVKKHRNPSRQRQKILFKELYNMTMDVEQDPDAFMHDMTELRDELQLLGSPIPDDQFLNIFLDCLPEQLCSGIKYEAETKEDLTLEQALYTMRNLYINRKEESGTSRAAKGRSSALSATTASSKFCSFCKKKGHTVETCWSRGKKPAGNNRATSVFLVNRLPHKALKGDTPYWRMFGKQANLSFLRIIGSRAFVYVEGYTTKLQARAWEGVLVGYDNDRPTFRIYNRTTGRITSSPHVTFIEPPPAVLPPADSSGDIETEHEPDSPDVDNIKDGITLLEQDDNSDSNKPEPAATISSRLRSSELTAISTAPGIEQLDGNGQPLVWKMKKSLYGLRQSPSVWNLTIDKDLRRKGYTPTASDPCVYTKGSGNSYVMPTLFVDDILLTGPSNTVLQEARQDLQRSFAMTDLGQATQILGIEIKQDFKKGTITLSQEKYTLSILKRFKIDSCNPSHTPGTGVNDKTSTATLLSDADKKEYQSLVGSLIFLINCTRYDIAFATMMAARRMSSATQRDLANAKRILRYLKKQPDLTSPTTGATRSSS